jgi:hypothetical protein
MRIQIKGCWHTVAVDKHDAGMYLEQFTINPEAFAYANYKIDILSGEFLPPESRPEPLKRRF